MRIEQSDGTAWMTFYCLAMLIISLLLAEQEAVYADMATKFLEHFVAITRALNSQQLFDAEDGFFYDVLITRDGWRLPLKVRSMVGVIPLLAAATLGPRAAAARLAYRKRFARFLRRQDFDEADLEMMGRARMAPDGRDLLLSVVAPDRLRQILTDVLDEQSFLSPYGLRSLSKRHATAPFNLTIDGVEASCDYEPGESTSRMFGGNSNWRGPVWFPINYLTITALERFHLFLGDDYTVAHPTGSGHQATLHEVADDLRRRLISIFLRGADGRRPVYGQVAKLQDDPAWRDNLLFFEYFHGETGAGLGASHQTGWTGLVAKLILDRATPVVPYVRSP